MKQTKVFLLTALITIAGFGAIISQSCKKDKCKGVACQNTGLCSNGVCSCPTGYSGAFCENSSIVYVNNGYTDLNMVVGGATLVVPALSSSSISGPAGSAIQVTSVYTQGSFGEAIDWADFTDYFPTGGDTRTEPFDIAAGYFFLQMKNVSSYVINSLYVNYQTPAATHEYPYIPNDGQIYDIGYYDAYSTTDVHAEAGVNVWDWSGVSYVKNSLFSVTAAN